MKLLARYNRLTIIVTTLIMLVAGIVYYYTITWVISKQVDKALVVEENEVRDYVAANNSLPHVFKTNHQSILFSQCKQPVARQFIDTVFRDLKEDEFEPARALYTSVVVKGQHYRVVVVQSTVETEDLLKFIFGITIGLIIILLGALFFINRFILSRIWKPFYVFLTQLKGFSVTESGKIPNIVSDIDEFGELDKAVGIMAGRVRDDYQALKSFTENASHELMTPISVINSRLDTFVQTGEFSDAQSKMLNDIYGTLNKLTRLNKSMLLLVKIENGLITDEKDIDLKGLIEDAIAQLEEIAETRQVAVTAHLKPRVTHASLLLMEILVNNLIGNAIRHNITGGSLAIILNEEFLRVSNTGPGQGLVASEIFQRFHKASASEGTGLGLTISKQICDRYGFELLYDYKEDQHHFTVNFPA